MPNFLATTTQLLTHSIFVHVSAKSCIFQGLCISCTGMDILQYASDKGAFLLFFPQTAQIKHSTVCKYFCLFVVVFLSPLKTFHPLVTAKEARDFRSSGTEACALEFKVSTHNGSLSRQDGWDHQNHFFPGEIHLQRTENMKPASSRDFDTTLFQAQFQLKKGTSEDDSTINILCRCT